MSWIEDLLARLTTVDTVVDAIKLITDALPDAGALTTIQADLDNPNQYKADLSTLETRLSAVRAAYLDELDFDLQGLLNAIAGYIDAEIGTIITSQGRILIPVDYWSEGKIQVQIGAAAATDALSDVSVTDIPAGATVVIAKLMFKFRMIENEYAGINKLDGATVALTSQVIQVDDSGATGYVDGINYVDDFHTLGDSAREGGDVIMGQVNVAARVDGNDTYSLRWLLAKADQDFINFDDCQVGIKIWYSV